LTAKLKYKRKANGSKFTFQTTEQAKLLRGQWSWGT